MLKIPNELAGKRAKLLPMEREHAQALYEAGQHPEIWAYMPIRITTPEEMERFVEQALKAKAEGTEFPFVIVDQETGRIVGSTRFLDISLPNRHLEIGWTWHSPDVWRTRINTECKYLLLRHCFETLDLLRVQLKTDGRNLRSQRAIERIGGIKEGVLRRQRILHDGYVRDTVYYSILAEEWPDVKTRLEVFLT
jgi:RimJ/RimL family protein N-acetyltransferase